MNEIHDEDDYSDESSQEEDSNSEVNKMDSLMKRIRSLQRRK
jgi:hypothetical protein